MMSFSKHFKSLCISCKPILINMNGILLCNGIRFCSTNTKAVRIFRPPRRNTSRIDFGGYFLLIIPVAALGLGTWQVFRKFEKDKIIEEFMEKVKLPPVELPKNLDELQDMEFRQVKVRGKFDHNKELFLGPRPKITDEPYFVGSTLLSRSSGGFMVITPFKLSDRNLTILVNRGWVPTKLKSPLSRPEGQIKEEVELVGLVRLHEIRQPLGMRNIPEIGSWIYRLPETIRHSIQYRDFTLCRDLYKMAEITGAAPVFLDANTESTVPGGPIGGQTIVEVRNVHLSYIYTWFGLALISSWLWYKRYLQRKPPIFNYDPRLH